MKIISVHNVWYGTTGSHEFETVAEAKAFLEEAGYVESDEASWTLMEGETECRGYGYVEPGKTLDDYGDGYEPVLEVDLETVRKEN